MSQDGRDKVAAIQSTRNLTDAQRNLVQATEQAASGFQLIEGEQVVNQPQIVDFQEFNSALQSTTTQLNQPVSDLQNFSQELESALPVDYFKNLADGTKAVSQMQQLQTESTLKLLEAQDRYANALKNLLSDNQQKQQNQPQFNRADRRKFNGNGEFATAADNCFAE